MRPEEYLRIVLRRWWLVPLLALVAAVVAYLYTAGQPATYSTSTTLAVTAEPLDQGRVGERPRRLGGDVGEVRGQVVDEFAALLVR